MKLNVLKSIKAVIFDMDGVITNTMPDHYKAWRIIMDDLRIPMAKEDVYLHEGQRGIDFAYDMIKKYRIPLSDYQIRRMLAKKESLFKKNVRLRFVPGAKKLLKCLYDDGLRLALVTGTTRHEMKKIMPKIFLDLFSVVVTASDVKNGKPHPEPFKRALKQLELISKSVIVVENAPFGIRAAKKAGLKCLAVTTTLKRSYLKEADVVFSSLNDLKIFLNFSKT